MGYKSIKSLLFIFVHVKEKNIRIIYIKNWEKYSYAIRNTPFFILYTNKKKIILYVNNFACILYAKEIKHVLINKLKLISVKIVILACIMEVKYIPNNP